MSLLKFTVVMVRDFPDFPGGWRGSYVLTPKMDTLPKSIMLAEIEIAARGGKYGAVIYLDEEEKHTIDRAGFQQ